MKELPIFLTQRVIAFMAYSDLNNAGIYTKALTEKKEWVRQHFPPLIIGVVGYDNLLDAPILTWKYDYIGESNSIECIPYYSMIDPIMVGVDAYQRAFVAVRTWTSGHFQVNTFYQKYSGIKTEWGHGIHTPYQYVPKVHHHLNIAYDQSIRDTMKTIFTKRSIVSPDYPYYQFMVI